MNKIWLGFLLFVSIIFAGKAQNIAVKSNLVYDATATLNLGAEYAINRQFSVDLSANYNGWDISKPRSWQHFMIQPEGRYWLHECFNGHFVGVHAMYGSYNIARLKVSLIDDVFESKYMYDGTGIGGGISYGYQLYITPRLNIEFSIGVGYVHLKYDKTLYRKRNDPDTKDQLIPGTEDQYFTGPNGLIGEATKGYFGPTKLGISIVYIIN